MFNTTLVSAQVSLEIERLEVSDIVKIKPQNSIIEDFTDGPSIYMNCSIINNTNDTIIFAIEYFKIVFNYEGIQYQNLPLWIEPHIIEKDSIKILPYTKIDFNMFNFLLLGNDFYNEKYLISSFTSDTIDCTKEVIEILPTLRVQYQDKNIDITSSGIKNVTVGSIPYIYK